MVGGVGSEKRVGGLSSRVLLGLVCRLLSVGRYGSVASYRFRDIKPFATITNTVAINR
jgi:hypothetical protein